MKHINQTCPKCQIEHWIRIDRLGAQMRCKDCNTLFYIDDTGNCRIGKRPAPVRDPHLYHDSNPSYATIEPGWLSKLPAPVRLGGAALGLLATLLAGLSLFSRSGSANIPESLKLRSTYIGEAVARDDADAIDAVLWPEGKTSARTWIKSARLGDWVAREDEKVMITTEVLNEGPEIAMVQAVVYAPSPGSQPPRKFCEMALFWQRDGEGPWLLNADRSIASR